MRRPTVAIIGLLVSLSTAERASAAAGVWNGSVSTDWNTASNWTGGVPAGGNATINLATGNLCTLTNDAAGIPVDILIGDTGTNQGRVDHRAGFLQTGNSNWMFVGRASNTATGEYNLADTSAAGSGLTGYAQGSGSLTAGKLWIGGASYGAGGVGTARINTTGIVSTYSVMDFGGANFSLASLSLGYGAGSSGTLYLENGTINCGSTLWDGVNGSGTLVMSGGALNVTHASAPSYVGYRTGSGILTISNGMFSVGYELRVGGSDINGAGYNATGTVMIAGGTVNLGALTIARGNNNQNTCAGTVTVTGGTLTSTNDIIVGYAGTNNLGKLVVGGTGTVVLGPTAVKAISVGQWDTTRGEIEISGGSLKLCNGSFIRFTQGNTAVASTNNVITQTSGAVTFYSDAGLTAGGNGNLDLQRSGSATVMNTYHLDGGILTVPQVISTLATGTRTFNFNGGTLRAATTGVTLMNLGAGNARANVRNGGAIVDSNGKAVTIAQALVHSNVGGDADPDGGLIKLGAGTLTLSGVNTYSGPTVVSNGVLAITGSLGTNAVTVRAGAALGGSGTVNGPVTLDVGSAAINMNNGTNETLTLAAGLTLNDGNGLNFEVGVTADKIAVAGAYTKNAGTVTISVTPLASLVPGTYDIITGAGIASTDGYALSLAPGCAVALQASGGNLQVVVGGLKTSMWWKGDENGVWDTARPSFNWNDAQTGGADAGTIPGVISDTHFSADGASNLVTSLGRDISVKSLNFDTAGDVTISGTNVLTIAGGLTNGAAAGSNSVSVSGVVLGADQTWANSSANPVIVAAPVSGAGRILTKTGPGSLIMSGLGSALKTLNLTADSIVDIGAGTLALDNGGGYALASTSGGTINGTGGGSITIAQLNAMNPGDNGTTNGTTLTINARITGANAFESYYQANGTGVMIMNNPGNDYAGDTVINSGVLQAGLIGNSGVVGNLGRGAGIHFGNGTTTGTLKYTGAGETNDRIVDLYGTTAGGTIEQAGSGLLKFTGNLTVTGNGAKTLTLTGTANGELAGTVPNGGSATSLTKTGTGTWTLSGNNTYTGGSRANGGVLVLSGSSSGKGWISVNNVGAQNAVLKVVSGTHDFYDMPIGEAANARGAVYQSAGTFTIWRPADNWDVCIGAGAGSYGYHRLSGGTLNLAATNSILSVGLGSGSTGLMDMSGGTLNVGEWIVVGRGALLSSGSFNVTGGTVAFGVVNPNHLALNWAGTAGARAVANIGGGAGPATVTGPDSAIVGLDLGRSGTAGTIGVANLLTNGTLTVGIVTAFNAVPTAILNFNGGTLKAAAVNAGPAFMISANIDSVNVYSGGSTFDDSGTSITIGRPLAAPAGAGVTEVAVTDGGSGFIGAPLVSFTDGTGEPATAVAEMVDDGTSNGTYRVSQILITSPGAYSVAPTVVTLTGGGPSAAATLGAVASTNNAGGGLVKLGSGTVTLSAVNTYAGPTAVSNGTLRVDGAIGPGAVSVAVGAGLGGRGTVGGSVTLASGNAAIAMANGVGETLTLTNGLTLADGNRLAVDVGRIPDRIAISGGAFIATGITTIEVSRVVGFDVGTYSIMTGASGISTGNFALAEVGFLPVGVQAALQVTGGDTLQVVITDGGPSNAFWKGGVDAVWNTADAGGGFNWASDAGGATSAGAPPSLGCEVTFAAAGASNFITTLGGEFAIRSLMFDSPAGITVAGANMLQLNRGITAKAGAGSNTIAAAGVLLGDDQTWTNDSAAVLQVNSPLVGGGAVSFAGTGTVVLAAQNTHTGGTTVTSGSLALAHPTDTLLNSAPLTVAGGTLSLGGNSDTVGVLTLAGGEIAAGALTPASCEVRSGIVSANLAGTGLLNKTAAGTVTLSGTNTYSGYTYARDGLLAVVGSHRGGPYIVGDRAGDNGALSIATGAQILLAGANQTMIVGSQGGSTGVVSMTGGSLVLSTELWLSGAPNASGTFNLSGGSVVVSNWTAVGRSGDNGNVNISGGSWTNVGAGNFVLASFLGNVGRVTVSGGELYSQNNVWIGEAGSGSLTIGGGRVLTPAAVVVAVAATGSGALNVTGGSLWMNTLTNGAGVGSVTLTGGTLGTYNSNGTWSCAMNLAGGNPNFAAADKDGTARAVAVSGLLSGAGGFTKAGSGTLILSTNNTYTGGTAVSNGVLEIAASGTIGGSRRLTVAPGAVLRVASGAGQVLSTNAVVSLQAGGTMALNATGAQQAQVLFLNGGMQPPGTYGATGSGATNIRDDYFSGSGVLELSSGLPRGVLLIVR